MAKYFVHYVVRGIAEFVAEDGQDIAELARFWAKNHAQDYRARVIQVLPEGVASTLGDDQPPEPTGPTRPLPPSDPGPLAPAVDQMDLRRAA